MPLCTNRTARAGLKLIHVSTSKEQFPASWFHLRVCCQQLALRDMCLLSGDRCICTDIRYAGAHSSNAIDISAAALPRGQKASCAIRESRGTMPKQSHPRWTVPCKISSAPHPRQQDQQAEYVETVPMLLKAHTRIQKYRPIPTKPWLCKLLFRGKGNP